MMYRTPPPNYKPEEAEAPAEVFSKLHTPVIGRMTPFNIMPHCNSCGLAIVPSLYSEEGVQTCDCYFYDP